ILNSWAAKTVFPSIIRLGADFSLNGTAYIAGGFSSGVIATMQAYNDGADTWSSKASQPTARFFGSSFGLRDRGFSVAGYDGSVERAEVAEYIDVQNVWL